MNVQLNLIHAWRHCVTTKVHVSSVRWIAFGSTGTEHQKFVHTFGTARRCGGAQR